MQHNTQVLRSSSVANSAYEQAGYDFTYSIAGTATVPTVV